MCPFTDNHYNFHKLKHVHKYTCAYLILLFSPDLARFSPANALLCLKRWLLTKNRIVIRWIIQFFVKTYSRKCETLIFMTDTIFFGTRTSQVHNLLVMLTCSLIIIKLTGRFNFFSVIQLFSSLTKRVEFFSLPLQQTSFWEH